MSILPHASVAPKPRSRAARNVPVGYAVLLVVILVAQLFTFDSFIELIPSLPLPFSGMVVHAIAPIVTAAELFALPFLLRMAVSPAFRWASMLSGWLVVVIWLILSGAATFAGGVTNVGLFGTVISVPAGAQAIGATLVLTGLTVYASWALWPARVAHILKLKNS